jgi:hypothetical protein
MTLQNARLMVADVSLLVTSSSHQRRGLAANELVLALIGRQYSAIVLEVPRD